MNRSQVEIQFSILGVSRPVPSANAMTQAPSCLSTFMHDVDMEMHSNCECPRPRSPAYQQSAVLDTWSPHPSPSLRAARYPPTSTVEQPSEIGSAPPHASMTWSPCRAAGSLLISTVLLPFVT